MLTSGADRLEGADETPEVVGMVHTSQMIPLEKLRRSRSANRRELAQLGDEAQRFLSGHKWCGAVGRGYLVRGWPGILAVFYFEIEPRGAADPAVWVIVGDLPPAYLDVEMCPNGAAAIDGYVGEMEHWVELVREGRSVDRAIPVYHRHGFTPIPPSTEAADMLASRLEFIRQRLLPELSEELKE